MPELYSASTGPESKKPTDLENKAKGLEPKELVREILRRTGETKRSAAMGSYVVSPEKRFLSMQHDEEEVLLLRAHPVTNTKWVIQVLLMLIAPWLIGITGVFSMMPIMVVFVAKLAWYLVTLGYSFERFLYWYYSVIVITNERIVDVDFVNLLQRNISYANLNHIEEPSMVSGGVVRALFHYGDINVATAADTPTVEAKDVPYPDRVIRIISELSEELEKRRERGE